MSLKWVTQSPPQRVAVGNVTAIKQHKILPSPAMLPAQMSVATESDVVQEPKGPRGHRPCMGHPQLSRIHRLEGTLRPGHQLRGPHRVCELQEHSPRDPGSHLLPLT